MTKRLEEIFSKIGKSDSFADIGCDHGYIAQAVLKNGRAKIVYITDISKKCLKKAEDLLCDYVKEGKAVPIITDGLTGVPEAEAVLIAGMGGEEIIKILKNARYFPKTLYLQPMKNVYKVRKFLADSGYKIDFDYKFFDGKFYDYIGATFGIADILTEDELNFGRTNLSTKSQAFIDFLNEEELKLKERLKGIKDNSCKPLEDKLKEVLRIKNDYCKRS